MTGATLYFHPYACPLLFFKAVKENEKPKSYSLPPQPHRSPGSQLIQKELTTSFLGCLLFHLSIFPFLLHLEITFQKKENVCSSK
jgi:hypothetical protein